MHDVATTWDQPISRLYLSTYNEVAAASAMWQSTAKKMMLEVLRGLRCEDGCVSVQHELLSEVALPSSKGRCKCLETPQGPR